MASFPSMLSDEEIEKEIIAGENLRRRLGVLSRAPGKCPVGSCDHMLFPSVLLIHCLHKHARDPHTKLAEVFEGQSLQLHFDPRKFSEGQPHCIGVLLYGGIEGNYEMVPARRHLNFPNAGLLQSRRRYANHLPIMVMICHSTWYALMDDKELEHTLVAMNGNSAGIYVIWLVSPITTSKVYYTLTIYDRSYKQARSVVRTIRNYTHSQKPSDFLPYEMNYLVLRDTEVAEFMQMKLPSVDKKLGKGINMDLVIHETPSLDEAGPNRFKNEKKSKQTQMTPDNAGDVLEKMQREVQPKKQTPEKVEDLRSSASTSSSKNSLEERQPQPTRQNSVKEMPQLPSSMQQLEHEPQDRSIGGQQETSSGQETAPAPPEQLQQQSGSKQGITLQQNSAARLPIEQSSKEQDQQQQQQQQDLPEKHPARLVTAQSKVQQAKTPLFRSSQAQQLGSKQRIILQQKSAARLPMEQRSKEQQHQQQDLLEKNSARLVTAQSKVQQAKNALFKSKTSSTLSTVPSKNMARMKMSCTQTVNKTTPSPSNTYPGSTNLAPSTSVAGVETKQVPPQ